MDRRKTLGLGGSSLVLGACGPANNASRPDVSTSTRDVFLPQPYIHPFPAPEDVFEPPVDILARHLHPLMSIDLSALDPTLTGRVHMINPLEPSDGLLAQSADEFWGPWLQPNWIGFRLTDSGKYELLADPKFFEIERIESDPTISDKNTWTHQQYLTAQESYAALRERYIQTGNLYPSDTSPEPWRALTQLGGKAPFYNLYWEPVPGHAFTYSEAHSAPMNLDGRLFRFVAATQGFLWREHGPDAILLWYDPVDRIVLESFGWG